MQSLATFQVDGHSYGMPKQYQSVQDFSCKDHMRENVQRMRQIQRQSREKERSNQQPVKGLWKSSKFENIQSRIALDLQKEPPAPRPKSANYLRAHSRSGPLVKVQSRPCSPDVSDKLSVPAANSKVNFIRNNFDFIKVNGIGAKQGKMMRSPSLSALDELKDKQDKEMKDYQKGEVPKYLRTRRAQWKKEEEDRIANTPDPSMPPGHRALSNEERKETLKLLYKKQDELQNQLSRLPLRTDTVRIRTVKNDIETKICEVEEAIKIFSRPKVFVKINQ